MLNLHHPSATDLRGTEVCARDLQVTRVALLRYRGVMAGVVRSMGVSGAAVEDVVHDAFELACRKSATERPDPQDEVRFAGWLCTLAKFAAMTARNDCARNREIASPAEEIEDASDAHSAYVGNFDDKVTAAVVLANLGAEDRKLLHQHFYEEKTIQELAAERGVPWTTMRSRLDGVIDRARTIMADKSYRRRSLVVVAFCWFTLHVRDLWSRLQPTWVNSKRAAITGILAIAAGGAVVAYSASDVEEVRAFAGTFGVAFTNALVASTSQSALELKNAANNASPIPPVKQGGSAGQASTSSAVPHTLVAAELGHSRATIEGVQPAKGDKRNRGISVWSVSADMRDQEPQAKLFTR